MTSCCVVVIGHVDHGKTALVRALSGIETDRLPEEKARGLSITPGFAHCAYAAGTLDLVDAPGHQDFIQAMISGASGARFALTVISLADGIQAQTLEHLRIAGLLGITDGVIAITKSDLLGPSEQAVRLEEIRQSLSQTPMAQADLVVCSAVTGAGIDTLHHRLEALLTRAGDLPGPLQAFLPIDRAFSVEGRGTVVTGTLLGQGMGVGQSAVVQPGGHAVTIRALQSRASPRDTVHTGERMAANLRGVAVSDLSRGAVLCAEGAEAPSDCMDAQVQLLVQAPGLKHMQSVRVLFGTSSAVAQVRLFGGGRIAQGGSGLCQLRFDRPVIGYAGQRGILRQLSPAETLGGVVLLDPQARPTRSGDQGRVAVLRAAQTSAVGDIATAICAAQGGVAPVQAIARLSRQSPDQVRAALSEAFCALEGGLLAAHRDVEAATSALLERVAAYHASNPRQMMAPQRMVEPGQLSEALLRHARQALLADGRLRHRDGRLALPGHDPLTLLPADQAQRLAALEEAFCQAGLTPPNPASLCHDEIDKELFDLLRESGRLVGLVNVGLKQVVILHPVALAAAAETLGAAFPDGQWFTTSQARTTLSTSRRVIVPVLEHFDSIGVTQRQNELRCLPAKE